jgi:hypothetical protein
MIPLGSAVSPLLRGSFPHLSIQHWRKFREKEIRFIPPPLIREELKGGILFQFPDKKVSTPE